MPFATLRVFFHYCLEVLSSLLILRFLNAVLAASQIWIHRAGSRQGRRDGAREHQTCDCRDGMPVCAKHVYLAPSIRLTFVSASDVTFKLTSCPPALVGGV